MPLLFAPETWPFGTSLAIMVCLSLIEGIGLLVASSPSSLIDNLLPEMPDGADGPLDWLNVGKVPALILLILFLGGFTAAGYALQAMLHAVTGALLPAWLAAIPAFLVGVFTVGSLGGLLARIIPKDETSAVSELSLLGRSGEVIQGLAREGMAAQAKVRDVHGHMHYVMVEPDLAGETFAEGSDVLLVRKVGARFKCLRNPHPDIL